MNAINPLHPGPSSDILAPESQNCVRRGRIVATASGRFLVWSFGSDDISALPLIQNPDGYHLSYDCKVVTLARGTFAPVNWADQALIGAAKARVSSLKAFAACGAGARFGLQGLEEPTEAHEQAIVSRGKAFWSPEAGEWSGGTWIQPHPGSS